MYVTHDLACVSQVADNLCVMYAGKVVEAGLTRAVFRAPEHPYTAGLLEAIPSSDERVALRGIAGRLLHLEHGRGAARTWVAASLRAMCAATEFLR